MTCENCGKQIDKVKINVFNYDGSDCLITTPIHECENNAVYFETDSNFCGYGLTEEEQNEQIKCPFCHKNPFKDKEVQEYEIVRVVKFTEQTKKHCENCTRKEVCKKAEILRRKDVIVTSDFYCPDYTER